MAVAKKNEQQPVKKTAAQVRKENVELKEKIEFYQNCGYCYMCDSIKSKDKFYVSTDPMVKGGITPICKLCAKKIALRVDKNGQEHEPTKESCQLALRYLNKPFINTLWEASIQESENLSAGKVKSNVWMSYVKNIAMGQYNCMTYFDSDMFKEKIVYDDETSETAIIENHSGQDTYDSFLKNKNDVIKLLDYDPFEKESLSDQPLLYSQLLGLLDSDGNPNDDMMRNASAISITRGFLQQQKIDDTITTFMGDIKNIGQNSATIKSLQDSKIKISQVITNLARDSCISLKHSKNAKKGENTWSGKIKKIKDLNLREGEINGFDIGTCRGMKQVQEMSDASIMKQLHLDESEWSDMVAEMRSVNVSLRHERDAYQELNRILLRENLDLKDLIDENDIKIDKDLVDLKELYSVFGTYDDDIIDEVNEKAKNDSIDKADENIAVGDSNE